MLYIDCELFIRKSCVLRIDNSHHIYTILTHGSQLFFMFTFAGSYVFTSFDSLTATMNIKLLLAPDGRATFYIKANFSKRLTVWLIFFKPQKQWLKKT